MAYFWKDIDIEFGRKNSGDIIDMTNEDAIVNSLSNIFQTLQGSRRMLPDFAMPIYNLLFEPIDEITAGRLAELIWDAIGRWETRIVIEGLDIVSDEDAGLYEINLNYYIGNTGNDDSISTFTDVIRAR